MAITIRPTEKEANDIDDLKDFLGIKTSSKALLTAAALLPMKHEQLEDAHQRIAELDEIIKKLTLVVDSRSEAIKEALEGYSPGIEP